MASVSAGSQARPNVFPLVPSPYMVNLSVYLVTICCLVSGLKLQPDSPILARDRTKPYTPVTSTPPANDAVVVAGLSGNAGMLPVTADGSSMFYWFFNRIGGNIQTDNVPLIMWLQGGPGCSSMTGAFFELGPLYVNETLGAQVRALTWANEFHLLFVDNPLGAGYSYAVNDADYVKTEAQMATNLYSLLQQLAGMHSTWFTNREFYVFGESYAGKYIPTIAYKILQENQVSTNINIPLAGVGIGDGWTNPPVQATAYADFGFAAGLLNEAQREQVEVVQRKCYEHYQQGELDKSNDEANEATDLIVKFGGGLNQYNIREFGDYNFTLMDEYLSLNTTKTLLNVPTNATFRDCGSKAYDAMNLDEMVPVIDLLPYLFNNTKVMFYNGQDDLICNASGTELYLSILQWYGLQGYLTVQKVVWAVAGQVAGYARTYGNLTQVVVLKAGHMVPMDQPVNSLDMASRFIYNKGFAN